jgi:hypothetical protein
LALSWEIGRKGPHIWCGRSVVSSEPAAAGPCRYRRARGGLCGRVRRSRRGSARSGYGFRRSRWRGCSD